MSHHADHPAQIHGHEVMTMMLEASTPFTRQSLHEAIQARFGAEARFYTCSAENMTALELIEFLADRGKFVEQPGGFSTDSTKICNH